MFQMQTPNMPQSPPTQTTITAVSKNTTTDAGEPITYLSTPNPEVTSVILSLPEGGKTDWMTHPVPGYLYILQGELTVEFMDGTHLVFKAGQAFMQARTK
jgi:quercetin dioxygenase-like cupin family protein